MQRIENECFNWSETNLVEQLQLILAAKKAAAWSLLKRRFSE